MNWNDYRKLLGLNCNDKRTELRCVNIILNELEDYFNKIYDMRNSTGVYSPNCFISEEEYTKFCNNIGIRKYSNERSYESDLIFGHLSDNKDNFNVFIFYFVSFINALDSKSVVSKKKLVTIIETAFNESKIRFEVLSDDAGYFVVPQGAKELDKPLVSDVFTWLQDYPTTQEIYKRTLLQYVDKASPRDVADNLRKTLETFLQEFFENTKTLDKNVSEVGKFFNEKNVNPELTRLFTTLLSLYDNSNNAIAKHHDDINDNMLEYLLYQTGVFIRALLKLK